MALSTQLLIIAFTVSLTVSPSVGDAKGSCKYALGVENGRISDSQLTASSFYRGLPTRQGRLRSTSSWSAARNDQNQWFQIDLGSDETVTSIGTTGRKNWDQWVRSYSVSYSSDGRAFEYFKRNGQMSVFTANYDRHTVVRNYLSPAITARYVRIHPVEWNGHISMRVELYGCPSGPCKSGEAAFGMKNGLVHKSEITASSFYNAGLAPYYGRLQGVGAWCVRINNANQWLQVDLGGLQVVTAIATQGRSNYNQWVKTYTVSYSSDGRNFVPYQRGGVPQLFRGNSDRYTIVTNTLSPTVNARYIRIQPKSWYRFTCTRVEIYGCYKGPCKAGAAVPFGVENTIPGSQLTASSYYNNGLSPQRGRLNSVTSWSARVNNEKQWFQVDLGRRELVTQVGTQGRNNYNQWVKTYSVSYSLNGVNFESNNKIYNGNYDRRSVVINVLSQGSVNARYIRIHPVSWYGHISMRAEIYGCNEVYIPPCEFGEVSLGVESKQKIPDSQMTSSSNWNAATSAARGRLYAGGAWIARVRDVNQWIQVDLGKPEVVTAVATQGRSNYPQWVTTYFVSYSLAGSKFDRYQVKGVDKIFNGNSDKNTIIKNVLSPPIKARYVRIEPQTWVRHISMRMGLYGCFRVPEPCDAKPCKNNGECTNVGKTSFTCKCRPYFIGLTCNTELPNPCKPNPCRNGGECVVLGNRYSCRCKPEFGGVNCEHGQSLCWASGDPHYRTFDVYKFNFMGDCEYDFAKDCSSSKLFTVRAVNRRCGRWVTCTAAVTVYIAGYSISFSRVRRTVIVNGVKITSFPIIRPGFKIINPSVKWLTLTTDIGLTVWWDCSMYIKVAVSGRFKGKTCSSALCGNNNGNRFDDNQYSRKCAPTPEELKCKPTSVTEPILNKCHLMNNLLSPFRRCNRLVDPTTLISDCKYDACRCTSPMECVCTSFAAYSKQCAGYGAIIDWRFKGTFLYDPLKQCEQHCKNSGEIFTECGSSCAKTCRDLSSDIQCNEECVAGCQCPKGQVLDDNSRCVPVAQCTCFFQGSVYQPGESIKVGNCKTCTCSVGAMSCVDDRKCGSKGPCESFPCKNQGICKEEGDKFSCKCTEDYQGKTCEELKPKPCDSTPCKNGGICTNEGKTFSCECVGGYQGKTCEERPANPCKPNPCKNGGTCIDKGSTFSCKCTVNFIGVKCETEIPDPCRNRPCKNGGVCIRLGNGYACRCKPEYGGFNCENGQSTCYAQGDPHYTTFDGRKFNFMGKCQYVFTKDCSKDKLFTVYTKNQRCGWGGASCTASVTVILAGYKIVFTRTKRTVVINGVKYTNFPIVRRGFTILNPNLRSLVLTADIGLTVAWDCNMNVKVTVSGRYKNKMCASALCGNNNGNGRDDLQFDRRCAPPPEELLCFPTSQSRPIVDKCHLMNDAGSPFRACNGVVDPVQLISNCKYDACRCQDPMQCVCSSFATYSKLCAAYGKVIDWRFQGTYLYPPLGACAQQCKNEGEIFTECGLSCARTCRDLSRDTKCNEACVPGCQCPNGQLLNDQNRCVPVGRCPCPYEGQVIQPGESVDVGNCKTCTCNRGAMACVEDRECQSKGPCESFPCKNGGVCTEKGSSFSCKCSADYQGKTCEKPKPKPCDSKPCKNKGICSNEGSTFSCECVGFYEGKSCEERIPHPCEPNPCKNAGTCIKTETSFTCKCPPKYIGKHCDQEPPNPCKPNPCKNGGLCRQLGNTFSCLCKDNTFGGDRCEYKQGTCEAHGDPHYTTFDKKKYNFQGACTYVFAEDCGGDKAFKVLTTNVKCGGRGATCTTAVTVYLNGNEIRFTREKRAVIIDRIKITQFPIKRPGYEITNPTKNWLRLTASIGLTVQWNSHTIVRVSVAGKYRGKMCGLCGNFNGNGADDTFKTEPECLAPPTSSVCDSISAVKNKVFMDKCKYMNEGPFVACKSAVDPSQLIKDCRYDACKCDDPMQCVCQSFSTYSQQCSSKGVVLKWRFAGTYLFPPLKKCAQQCSRPDEIFTECGSSCARSCRDLSNNSPCKEECVAGCQCPRGKVLNHAGRCVLPTRCACEFEGKIVPAGQGVDVGKCTTCTCNRGAMRCIEDKECLKKGPCDSLPCKNNGVCSPSKDGSFSCKCTEDFQGETCEEPKPQPCDSKPCKNDGICTNEGKTFSCECKCGFEGRTCEELKKHPCDSSPCKNGGECINNGDDFKCECTGIYSGKTCEEVKCEEAKLDILYVVDGSGSVHEDNFEKVKKFIQRLNARFNIGPDKTRIALMEFGDAPDTKIVFNLGEKQTLKEVNEGVEGMEWLASLTATGDALRQSREKVFTGKGGDRPDAANVLLLFTDGEATDKQGENYQVEQAQKLKADGVKVVTVAMGEKETIDKFRDKLREMASKSDDTAEPLVFEADFKQLDSIADNLVKETCDTTTE